MLYTEIPEVSRLTWSGIEYALVNVAGKVAVSDIFRSKDDKVIRTAARRIHDASNV